MEEGGEAVAGEDEAADLVASGLDAEDFVRLRVVEKAGVDVFVCEGRDSGSDRLGASGDAHRSGRS